MDTWTDDKYILTRMSELLLRMKVKVFAVHVSVCIFSLILQIVIYQSVRTDVDRCGQV